MSCRSDLSTNIASEQRIEEPKLGTRLKQLSFLTPPCAVEKGDGRIFQLSQWRSLSHISQLVLEIFETASGRKHRE
jgi:hypothetical protein